MSLVLEAIWNQMFTSFFPVNTLVNRENAIQRHDIFYQESGTPTSLFIFKIKSAK